MKASRGPFGPNPVQKKKKSPMVFFSDLPAVVKDFAGAGLQNYWYGPWLFKEHVENGVI
jgi:hypothetical protein